ncbi:MAG: hypothetical protein ABL998_12555, partial [Planctomycetota bacterium]
VHARRLGRAGVTLERSGEGQREGDQHGGRSRGGGEREPVQYTPGAATKRPAPSSCSHAGRLQPLIDY